MRYPSECPLFFEPRSGSESGALTWICHDCFLGNPTQCYLLTNNDFCSNPKCPKCRKHAGTLSSATFAINCSSDIPHSGGRDLVITIRVNHTHQCYVCRKTMRSDRITQSVPHLPKTLWHRCPSQTSPQCLHRHTPDERYSSFCISRRRVRSLYLAFEQCV